MITVIGQRAGHPHLKASDWWPSPQH
ncbi:hypothetical protein MED121_19384 [Marinomonas sp. MED121]|nr:hypothetical protein MED121_19384 [Marinomonas sp. MED121]